MKSGTGDDPFADEADEEPPERDESEEEVVDDATPEPETAADSGSTTATEPPEPKTQTDDESDSDNSSESAENTTETPVPNDTTPTTDESPEIPWVLRRDGVKDDRPNMTQFFLQDSTDSAERDFRNDVESILNKDVYLLDLREAAYQVAMEHPDEVASVLDEWGYDYL